MESLGDEYTKPAEVPIESELLVDDTDAIDVEYYTMGLISQIYEDLDDSEELRADVQNLLGRKIRNSVLTSHRKIGYLEPHIPSYIQKGKFRDV